MNEPKYTPGPWHVSADGHAGGNVFRFNVSGPHFTPEGKAQAVNDARLIAKAPDMLELLRDAFDRFTDNDMMPPNQALKTWLDKAKIIFQKLEG